VLLPACCPWQSKRVVPLLQKPTTKRGFSAITFWVAFFNYPSDIHPKNQGYEERRRNFGYRINCILTRRIGVMLISMETNLNGVTEAIGL
jgi:hypothetical protein